MKSVEEMQAEINVLAGALKSTSQLIVDERFVDAFKCAQAVLSQPGLAERVAALEELRDSFGEIQEYVSALPEKARDEHGLILIGGQKLTIGALRRLAAARERAWGKV